MEKNKVIMRDNVITRSVMKLGKSTYNIFDGQETYAASDLSVITKDLANIAMTLTKRIEAKMAG